MDKDILQKKICYIPQCVNGEISIRKCASLIGITPQSVCRLKIKFKKFGMACFIHGNTGKTPKNKQYNDTEISSFYKEYWQGSPFAGFRDALHEYKNINASYSKIYKVLSEKGFVSPRARIPIREKKKHLSRKERPHEGDLLQVDASPYDWFMIGDKCTLHGGIDDATHKVTALYFCKNECLLGYFEVMRRTHENCGGFPLAAYTDKAACFVTVKQSLDKVTIQEQLAGIRKNETQWQQVCKFLEIEHILALSPEAKGRIERLWQTLQGRLPFLFRFLGIKTIEAANEFLIDFVDKFNARFSVPAQNEEIHYRNKSNVDFDYLFSVKKECKTKSDGTFLYHGYKFKLIAPLVACKNFSLCLSERFGIKAVLNGKYYPVELREPITYCTGDQMPIIEKELIFRYLLADSKSGDATISCA